VDEIILRAMRNETPEVIYCCKVVRAIDPNVRLSTIEAFMHIVLRTYLGNRTMQVGDVGKAIGTSSASATRTVSTLVNYGLVETYNDPNNLSVKLVRTGPDGVKLMVDLLRELPSVKK